MTFVNKTSQTIWVAAAPDHAATPLAATGWVLPAGQQRDDQHCRTTWNGRFWGRTGCVFNSAGVGPLPDRRLRRPVPVHRLRHDSRDPRRVNLDAWDGLDFYDVSMVDGSNLPMYINTTNGATPGQDQLATAASRPAAPPPSTAPARCSQGRRRRRRLRAPPARASAPTSTAAVASGRRARTATRLSGRLTTPRSSRRPSRTRTPTSTMTRRACSPAGRVQLPDHVRGDSVRLAPRAADLLPERPDYHAAR